MNKAVPYFCNTAHFIQEKLLLKQADASAEASIEAPAKTTG
jgi:hypothetical protein